MDGTVLFKKQVLESNFITRNRKFHNIELWKYVYAYALLHGCSLYFSNW